MDYLVDPFCDLDDFCNAFIPAWEKSLLADGTQKHRRASRMTPSEMMTILIAFHIEPHCNFKQFYIAFVQRYWHSYSPNLLSYTRFIELRPGALVPLCRYFATHKGTPSGLVFIDSTSLAVCHNIRIPRRKVFVGQAKQNGERVV